MKLYTIKKGKHKSKPVILKYRLNPKSITWLVRFNDDCKYVLGDNDQYDWNKLCGLAFHWYKSRYHSAMIGWRYNISTGFIEVNAYYHLGTRKAHYTNRLLSIRPGRDDLKITLSIDREQSKYIFE